MKTTVKKWGNSLAVRIPKNVSEDIKLKEGSTLDITTENGNIILTPSIQKYSLDDLLNQISEENIHKEVQTGEPTGGETW